MSADRVRKRDPETGEVTTDPSSFLMTGFTAYTDSAEAKDRKNQETETGLLIRTLSFDFRPWTSDFQPLRPRRCGQAGIQKLCERLSGPVHNAFYFK